MPSPVILLSANDTAPCFRFLLRQCPRFHGVAKNALIALHGKLNKIAQAIAFFFVARRSVHVAQWLEYAGLAVYLQR